jgi:hypothetical protein
MMSIAPPSMSVLSPPNCERGRSWRFVRLKVYTIPSSSDTSSFGPATPAQKISSRLPNGSLYFYEFNTGNVGHIVCKFKTLPLSSFSHLRTGI